MLEEKKQQFIKKNDTMIVSLRTQNELKLVLKNRLQG